MGIIYFSFIIITIINIQIFFNIFHSFSSSIYYEAILKEGIVRPISSLQS